MVTIKFANIRIDLSNKTTYSVIKKVDKETRETRHAIFFNLNGGGYREFIAFKTKKAADYVAGIIDTIDGNFVCSLSEGPFDGYYYVFDRNTGQPVKRYGLDRENGEVRPEECYIHAYGGVIDITPVVNDLCLNPIYMKDDE